ncbi:RasGEF domain-containing protein [Diaporthe helianthi]|uniref:RasGEF domain-containing protein n=1 Tax=Diaporthe helianthi TaxID=158607 RepID=A0A2P5IGC1_DIAHE|nr:RasGEF domain-containing protein [Diaporthe helianthi]
MPTANLKPSPRQQARRPPQSATQRKDVARAPVFLRPAPRDAAKARRPLQPRRAPDLGAPTVAPNKPRMRTTPTQKATPLLPVTERKSQEERTASRRPRKNSDHDRWDITPDGGSAGREGRQFTVANVGNNGRIYLRPTVRPAHQRHPQPPFIFPMTPPQTAGLGATPHENQKREGALDMSQLQDSQWTPSLVPSTPTTGPLRSYLDDRKASLGMHRRTQSDSTIHESRSSVARESDPGAFKIVVTQPGEEQRPRTLEDLEAATSPFLEISIPSWKLGTPRFSVKGTPFIRGSSYAPTEDMRSSNQSMMRRSGGITPRFASSTGSRRPGSLAGSASNRSMPQRPAWLGSGLSPHEASRAKYMSSQVVIEPEMFDSLTFKPACDDRTIVRYSSLTGAVTAATPPRLVAEITSPTFLDYELLSDFFLTFRAYLSPMDLLQMLFSRMRWALMRDGEVGVVVRVRTFVALRHWILNYFVDDFVCEYEMRTGFCRLLNSLTDDVSQDSKGRRVQLKILAELKKCWRRVCAQFWDGPESEASPLPAEAPIAPGGIPGHRNPSLDPEFWQRYLDNGPPTLDNILAPLTSNAPESETSFYRDVARAGGQDIGYEQGQRPATPEHQVDDREMAEEAQVSPTSISSGDIVSCSFPTRTLKSSSPGSTHPLGAHPVDPSSIYNMEPIATTPRALMGKRLRPQQAHKRNGSLSHSMREHNNTTLEQLLQQNTETLLALPYAGSLVRGNVMPPGQAFVEIVSPTATNGASRQTTVFQPYPDDSEMDRAAASAMSGQGMRRLISGVRRALSTRGQDVSPTQGNFNIAPIGPRGVTTNRLPGTAIVPQAQPRTNSARPVVRIDLLGAEIVEDFKRVIREDAAAEAALQIFHGSTPSTPTTVRAPGEESGFSVPRMEALRQADPQDGTRPFSDDGVTAGSKSILIIDDTLRVPDEFPTMTGALPAFTQPVEDFADSFMPQGGADPTPPTTPPGRITDTPRRSSYLLNQHVLRSVKSTDALPPFVPDLDSLAGGNTERQYDEMVRPPLDDRLSSSEFLRQSLSRPPLSGVYGHGRHRSSRSLRSNGTMGLRKYASFQSGMGLRSTVRSFDATTYSDRASIEQSSVPPPLKVLRRRPGGDLRAVNHVGDLDQQVLRKSRSLGSLTTFTDSLGTSFLQSPALGDSDYPHNRVETFSLGVPAERPKRRISLLSTSSSRPIMRPSFEAEAQKLANIPDDEDDGGVESTLLKLEGRYERRPFKLSLDGTNTALVNIKNLSRETPPLEERPDPKAEKRKHRQEHIGEEGVTSPAPAAESSADASDSTSLRVPAKARSLRDEVGSFLSDGSDGSYLSIPLLQREVADDSRRSRAEWTNQSILQDAEDGTSADEREIGDRDHSFEFVKKSESIEKIKPGDTMPTPKQRDETRDSSQSFLDIDSTDDELSSELSDNPADEDEELDAFPSLRRGATLTKIQTNYTARSYKTFGTQTKRTVSVASPRSGTVQTFEVSPETADVPELHSAQIWGEENGRKPLPPTPDYTPTFEQATQPMKPGPGPTSAGEISRNVANMAEQEKTRDISAHLPFVLAFDSEILAQQFTLIEKDALNEIDWKELIEMRWKNADHNDCRSWVQFLRDADARGVEVVIARFNIVVKWAVSEIVLTQNMEERARCIIKYIHIAAHCRRYRNFATMSQIAIALTSGEVERLSQTWRMVPAHDIHTLRELEALISPTRNFYALRSEMEGGGLTTHDMGCIPFVGIYTHDLIFNAQRPSEIASSPTTAPLVNFERCRIAAGVVKTLLRLLEASTTYNFQPIEGITERCLWMSALSDDEIRQYSQRLQ